MNEKFNKNAKVEKFTNMLGIAVRLIVIDPLFSGLLLSMFSRTCISNNEIKTHFIEGAILAVLY